MGARAPSVRRREKCRGDRPFEGGFRPPSRPRRHPGTGGHQRDARLCSRTARPRNRGGSRMSAVIFTGPTLSAVDARMVLDADYRPPAAEGDVYRAAQGHPHLIGIIDGYFERIPAVWHKEILWAMSHGIHVFGAASMGALRAAELDAFGMEGIGAIFEAYRDGSLEDDDEVAVAHAGPEFGFRAVSEAMVDIRFTLGLALDAGALGAETYAALEAAAKALFYPNRNYAVILERAADLGAAEDELLRFREWLPTGRASLKRDDALAMLNAIGDRLASGLEPKRVKYAFENTWMWESAWRLEGDVDEKEDWLRANDLDELRLAGLLDDEARAAWIKSLAALDASGYIIDQLRVSGDYPRLMARARDKHLSLGARGLEDAVATDAGLGVEELVRWYFEDRLGRKVPDDLNDYCRTYGIESRAALERTLGREFCYLKGSTVRVGTEG